MRQAEPEAVTLAVTTEQNVFLRECLTFVGAMGRYQLDTELRHPSPYGSKESPTLAERFAEKIAMARVLLVALGATGEVKELDLALRVEAEARAAVD